MTPASWPGCGTCGRYRDKPAATRYDADGRPIEAICGDCLGKLVLRRCRQIADHSAGAAAGLKESYQ